MLKQRIEQGLKEAMLGGDKQRVSTLRVIKSTILYAEVAKGLRDIGLSDAEISELLSREAKKRQEAADLYQKAGETERMNVELAEKAIIEAYLPRQLSDDELSEVVQDVIASSRAASVSQMGRVISEVKNRVGSSADGARIAHIVKKGLAG